MIEKYISIGKVVDRLQQEYPDLSISKVRFLEAAGLISPKRKPSGYRLFTEADIARLKTILQLQRDHFLPLQVIKERLNKGLVKGAKPAPQVSEEIVVTDTGDKTFTQVLRDTGVSPEFLQNLEDYDLVAPEDSSDGKRYSPTDQAVIDVARKLGDLGFEPRHLRIYENLVEKEVLALEQLVLPFLRQRSRDGKTVAIRTIDTYRTLSSQLRQLLLNRVLEEKLPNARH